MGEVNLQGPCLVLFSLGKARGMGLPRCRIIRHYSSFWNELVTNPNCKVRDCGGPFAAEPPFDASRGQISRSLKRRGPDAQWIVPRAGGKIGVKAHTLAFLRNWRF